MVTFNELIVKETKLIIDVSIEDLCYYDKMFIKSIKVTALPDNKSKVFSITEVPSVLDSICKAFYGVIPSEKEIEEKDNTTKLKRRRVRLELTDKDLELKTLRDYLFYIEVELDGLPSPETPCGLDNKIDIAYTYYVKDIYTKSLMFIKNSKDIDLGFVDFILQKKALDLALDCGNLNKALEYFKLLRDTPSKPIKKACNCHG